LSNYSPAALLHRLPTRTLPIHHNYGQRSWYSLQLAGSQSQPLAEEDNVARPKGTAGKYTKAQRMEVLKRIQSGETQNAVAAATGVPLATVGYWARKANGAGGANSASRRKAKPARAPRQARTRGGASAGIAWALDGDVLVIRIPLRAFARQIAEEALAKI
jgi:hypothetical protein